MWEGVKREWQKVPATKLVALSTEVVEGQAKALNGTKRGYGAWMDVIQSW
jgi:hypothetical protein